MFCAGFSDQLFIVSLLIELLLLFPDTLLLFENLVSKSFGITFQALQH